MNVLIEHLISWLVLNIIVLYITCLLSRQVRYAFHALIYPFYAENFVVRFFDSHKAVYLRELKSLKTDNATKLKMLEVGPASGYNFEFYPDNISLTALDYNGGHKESFLENLKNYPNISFDKYVVAPMENMKGIPDETYDIVLTTYVMCSVDDQVRALSEAKRVLKKGGAYYFVEHVAFPKDSIVRTFLKIYQDIFQVTINYPFGGGCYCNRETWNNFDASGFEKIEYKMDYPLLVTPYSPQMHGKAIK